MTEISPGQLEIHMRRSFCAGGLSTVRQLQKVLPQLSHEDSMKILDKIANEYEMKILMFSESESTTVH